jgi:hypothetical protein
MHGIVREGSHKWGRDGTGVTTILIRYTDGRTLTVVPDAGRETFSEDDILELKNVISRASATAEWAAVNTRLGF